MIAAGQAFWVYDRNPHWRFVISDPQQDQDRILAVNFTTFHPERSPLRSRSDRACLLNAGDHPTVTHTSCMCYGDSLVYGQHQFDWMESRGKIRYSSVASPSLLARMRRGAEQSIHMIPDHFQVLIDQGLVSRS